MAEGRIGLLAEFRSNSFTRGEIQLKSGSIFQHLGLTPHPLRKRTMIRHIVFITVSADKLADAEAGLKPLEGIGHADVLEVRRNLRSDALSGEVDLVVYGEFADPAALERYKADPVYAQAIETVRPLRQLRIVADVAS
jgi:hypothetical protein